MKLTATLDPSNIIEESSVLRPTVVKALNNGGTKAPKIAYLLKTYPRLSETFILNEILGMEELGARLHILSLRRPDDERFHPAVDRVKAAVTYARALGRRSHPLDALTVVYRHMSLFLRHPKAYIRTVRTYLRRPGHPRLKELVQAGYLAGEIRKAGCTHLHAHFANVPTTVAEIIKGFSGVPYSFTAHAKDIYHSSAEELDRKMRGAEFVLTCTAFNRRHLQEISTSDTPIHCIYHGIDLTLFDGRKKNRHAEGSPSAAPLILSVGRFCEKKGFPYLIRACKLLKDKGVAFRCLIVGYGPMREELDAMIGELDLRDSVSLVGMMTQDQIAEVYRQADVFALPCLVTGDGDRDGIPNVLIEAMAQRVPVISTDVSGISELVTHMENGLLVPEKDAEAVASGLVMLLHHPVLRDRMGEMGREKVLRLFSLETSASAVWGAFQEGLVGNNCACESETP
ncbi:MAG: glycosyltransferase [Acidobacteriaceae bacterium]